MSGEELQVAERHLPDRDVQGSAHGVMGIPAGHGSHRWDCLSSGQIPRDEHRDRPWGPV